MLYKQAESLGAHAIDIVGTGKAGVRLCQALMSKIVHTRSGVV